MIPCLTRIQKASQKQILILALKSIPTHTLSAELFDCLPLILLYFAFFNSQADFTSTHFSSTPLVLVNPFHDLVFMDTSKVILSLGSLSSLPCSSLCSVLFKFDADIALTSFCSLHTILAVYFLKLAFKSQLSQGKFLWLLASYI